ncbi:sulfotransferase [Bremerella cremea]|uniref:Sulfotransferase n=1 Tax=Bremerella cremea TaxID=1031537 RepID=A0A368KRQ0_9BACT|nr:sulfotransferase [Bremerella cremea]RCS49476.1 sulfotransferase [Bremerella cremea]
MMNFHRPVFLLGCCYRCGSTLLQRLISSSGTVFIWGENDGMAAQFVDMQEKCENLKTISERQWSGFERQGLNHWLANLNPHAPDSFTHAAREFLITYYSGETRRLGYDRWGFKEVHHGWKIASFLLECFPEGRIVYLLRNPRDVLASNAATNWYSKSGFASGVLQIWCDNTRAAITQCDSRILTVRYEDLVSRSNGTMLSVLSHIGCDSNWESSLLRRHVRGMRLRPKLGQPELKALALPEVVELYEAAYRGFQKYSRGE